MRFLLAQRNSAECLLGFPSVGKSTRKERAIRSYWSLIRLVLSKVTNTASEAAAYEFTTLTAIPGVLEYKGNVLSTQEYVLLRDEVTGVRIQLLDLPGIVEGAAQGRGRGRQVVAGRGRLIYNIWLFLSVMKWPRLPTLFS